MRESILDRLLIEKSLNIVNESDFARATDNLINSSALESQVKNVCAKVSPDLSDRIDNIVGLLRISKRSFLETIYIDACDRAEKTMREEGVYEYFKEEAKERKESAA